MSGNIRTWPMPHTEMPSDMYALEAEGTSIPVWLSRVRETISKPKGCGWTNMLGGPAEWCSFARFDAEYPVDVTIKILRPFHTAQILPRSAGIPVEIEGGTVRLRIERPGPVTLCLDGGDEHPLHVFCREIETRQPGPNDRNTIYFGPGEHWVHSLQVKSGQTVYLDGGAVLRATLPQGAQGKRGGVLNLTSYGDPVLHVDGVEDVRICGRGIIDGGCLPHPAKNLIRVNRSHGVRIEGVTLRNSPSWHLPICASREVTVEDLACLSGRLNSDGINCVNSSRVAVRRTFVRSHDDSFVVKTTMPDVPSSDICYERCVAWDDWGYAFGVSYETRSDIGNVTFRDCDVIFARNWPLGIHVSDGGTVGPVLFERIGIHYPRTSLAPQIGRQCMQLRIVKDQWGKDDRRGHIRGITFRDVEVAGVDVPAILLAGFDADHAIGDVSFQNVRVNGRALASPEDHIFQKNEHVRDVTVTAEVLRAARQGA